MAGLNRTADHAGMRSGPFLAFIAFIAAAVSAAAVHAATSAEPTSFTLVFDGRHNAQFQHEGTFTTAASWCPSGTAADVSVDATTDTATRRFVCPGGDEFTATVRPLPAEHGGRGQWQITGGTGSLATLRGKGTFTSALVSGRADDPATIVFRSTWTGFANFDADPPTVAVTPTVRRLPATGTYTVRLAMSIVDGGGGTVSYVLQIVAPKKPTRALVYKLGQTTGSSASTFRLKVSSTTRTVRLLIDATDAVGNTTSFSRTIRLR